MKKESLTNSLNKLKTFMKENKDAYKTVEEIENKFFIKEGKEIAKIIFEKVKGRN